MSKLEPKPTVAGDPVTEAGARRQQRRRFQAAYKLTLLSALSCLCLVMVQLILDRRAAHATDGAPSSEELQKRLERVDPIPARQPAFDPSQVSLEALLPEAVPDITLSAATVEVSWQQQVRRAETLMATGLELLREIKSLDATTVDRTRARQGETAFHQAAELYFAAADALRVSDPEQAKRLETKGIEAEQYGYDMHIGVTFDGH